MSGLLSLGTRAMFLNYAALQTTGANISNANTAGYSRQEVQVSTAGGQYTGAGFFGKGAQIDTVSRSSDAFLTRQAARHPGPHAAQAADRDQHDRLLSLRVRL